MSTKPWRWCRRQRTHQPDALSPQVEAESAAALALSVHGGGLVAETIAGRPAWVNDCLAEALPCRGAIAAWSDPYFMVVEFDSELGGGPPTTTPETAHAVVEAVLAGLAE